ncbi:class I mannose-6-phosphate isomerase [Qipengyuania sp. 6B39]|uniref:class I mannose-6-phosphate isomerase n=1 Tax=Qipengyuania proteolytica TaxID=2867239 RepID=UPI001C8A43E3|nr:class I mannose-6-phosphate isomerase [Qipengyuania proteolytica]MBX7496402.1 class I mannose-6-phosphate isomerase [Qipengyuania proteolytica]
MIRRLPRGFVEKVWGVDRLPPPFPHPSESRIGEVWFKPPAELDQLLVKYIFASERLSIQNHPDDEQAVKLGLGREGKSECWVILDADEGATIAAGFRETLSKEEVRRAAVDGSIVEDLVWHEVRPGDAFYIPAGTVHAIGGGVSLIEVQQNSDVTFRLFDYGRPRELHLDQGVAVADLAPYPERFRTRMNDDCGVIVDGPHFRLTYARAGITPPQPLAGPALVIPFSGRLLIDDEWVEAGECVLVAELTDMALEGSGLALIAQAM